MADALVMCYLSAVGWRAAAAVLVGCLRVWGDQADSV